MKFVHQLDGKLRVRFWKMTVLVPHIIYIGVYFTVIVEHKRGTVTCNTHRLKGISLVPSALTLVLNPCAGGGVDCLHVQPCTHGTKGMHPIHESDIF